MNQKLNEVGAVVVRERSDRDACEDRLRRERASTEAIEVSPEKAELLARARRIQEFFLEVVR